MEFTWTAVYKDGSEHPEEEFESASERINRGQLSEFRISTGGNVVFVVYFRHPKRKLVFRRRRIMNMNNPSEVTTVTIVGWHEKVSGKSVISLCYIHDNGLIEFDDDRDNLVLVPCEV